VPLSVRSQEDTISIVLTPPYPSPFNMPPRQLTKKPKRKRYDCFIWPKDPGTSTKFPVFLRFLDLLSGKGPDIFIGTFSSPASYPRRAAWSQWSHLERRTPVKTASALPFWSVDRSPTELYDFRTRKYKEWTPEWNPAAYPRPGCSYVPETLCDRTEAMEQFNTNERGRGFRCSCDDCRAFDASARRWFCEPAPAHLLCHECQSPHVRIADYRCDAPNDEGGRQTHK
jgi:hypothetical protein